MIKLNKITKVLVRKTKSAARKITKRRAQIAFKKGFRFTFSQIHIRPRMRLFARIIVVLLIALIFTSKGISYLRPKEANIRINGQAVLVANDMPKPVAPSQTIEAGVHAIRNPFLVEKPIDGPISQGYSAYHRGIDITDPMGTQIKPVGPGIVAFAGFSPDGYGNMVIVDHGDGLETAYAHMAKINVGVGNTVSVDNVIGTVGMTGRTTGPHVHFEVRDHGVQVNPLNVLPQ